MTFHGWIKTPHLVTVFKYRSTKIAGIKINFFLFFHGLRIKVIKKKNEKITHENKYVKKRKKI